MSPLRARRGTSIAELVVAFTVLTLLSALAATALVGAERRMRTGNASSVAERAVREGAAVLTAELAGADSLVARGDTAIDFLGMVGVTVVCTATDRALVVPPSVASDASPFSIWRSSPSVGDVVALFDPDAARWRYSRVDSVAARSDGAGCTPSSGLLSVADSTARRPVLRFVLDAPLPAGLPVGAPARVMRRGRWALYRGGDGQWALGLRACDPIIGCGTAQPASGPYASARDSGFTVRVDSTVLTLRLRAPLTAAAVTERAVRMARRNRDP
jgi:hypothetical protein